MKRKLFQCGRLFRPEPESERTCILAEGGKIADFLTMSQAASVTNVEWIDLSAYSVGPGLVDIHCHGAMGSDFADGRLEDVAQAARYHLRHGTTSLVATIGSCSEAEMLRACDVVRGLMTPSSNLAGIHLEGPYFSPDLYGCHLPEAIRDPAPEEWRKLEVYRDILRIVTLAPERPGALDFIRAFAPYGTVFSLGHSTASYEEIRRAVDAGAAHSCHMFCAMTRAERKNLVLEPGTVESVFLSDELSTEIIGDGIHVGPRLCELIVKVKGRYRTALVSDALRGVGCPPGEYAVGPRNGQMCRLLETPRVGIIPERPGILASSGILLADALRILARSSTLSLADLWAMASATPARIVGIEACKGRLNPGYDADLLALDGELNPACVYLGGESAA